MLAQDAASQAIVFDLRRPLWNQAAKRGIGKIGASIRADDAR